MRLLSRSTIMIISTPLRSLWPFPCCNPHSHILTYHTWPCPIRDLIQYEHSSSFIVPIVSTVSTLLLPLYWSRSSFESDDSDHVVDISEPERNIALTPKLDRQSPSPRHRQAGVSHPRVKRNHSAARMEAFGAPLYCFPHPGRHHPDGGPGWDLLVRGLTRKWIEVIKWQAQYLIISSCR